MRLLTTLCLVAILILSGAALGANLFDTSSKDVKGREFGLDAARGHYTGLDDLILEYHVTGDFGGTNGDTGYDAWEGSLATTADTTVNFISTATVLSVHSGSANDAAAGTGARSLTITGLDSDYAVQTETVVPTGLTTTTTTNGFLRVTGIEVASAGSGAANAGEINLYDSSGNRMGMILAGRNSFDTTGYTVPADKDLYITKLSAGRDDTATGIASLFVREYGGVWKDVGQVSLGESEEFAIPIHVDEKADLRVKVHHMSAATTPWVRVEGYLVDE